MDNGYHFLIAYAVAIVLILLLIKTKIGYIAVYYFIVVSIIILLLTNYKQVAKIFSNNTSR